VIQPRLAIESDLSLLCSMGVVGMEKVDR